MSGEVSRHKVKFTIEDGGEAIGELIRFLAPRTVETLLRVMPIQGRVALWKEEVYFETQIKMGSEKEKPTVEKGAIAYWPLSSAICIFYGGSQPYSPVNVVGRITEGLDKFRGVKPGSKIVFERI
jgi:hypothetical protein